MSLVYRRHRPVFSDRHRPRSSQSIPLQEYTDAAEKTSSESLDVSDIRVAMKRSSSTQSLNSDLVDAVSDDSFQKEVAEKTQSDFVGKQEAETEVLIDRVVRKEGSKDKALLYVVSKIENESKVQMLINTLLHRGANPSASNNDLWTPLHFAVKKNFKGVCSKLLENEAWPDARDKHGVMPYTLAYNAGNDDVSAMLIHFMSNLCVRRMYTNDGRKPAEFSFHKLLEKKMQGPHHEKSLTAYPPRFSADFIAIESEQSEKKTVLAVLDCMMDTQSPSGHVRVYYNVLDSDDNGIDPTQPDFNPRSKSPLQIIAKSGNKTIVYHDVVRLLIRRKWKKYARFRFLLNSLFYVITLIAFTYSAIVAAMTPDPMMYNLSGLHIVRAICDVWSIGMAVLTFLSELNQLRKHKIEYFHDAFNYIDMSSSVLIIAILPLRCTHRQEQWPVFSVAYLLWTIRVFKYAAVFRQTGAYAQILWRILVHDFFQFITFFAFILLAFSGCLLLSLRGEQSLDKFPDISSFWSILFLGVQILIEAEKIIEYTELKLMSLVIMVAFLFTICVLLLNILIAQLSDTYHQVQMDAQRGLEVNRAWVVARVELNSLYIGKGHRANHYKESEIINSVRDILEKWETPPLNEMNKSIEDMCESLDTHKLNLMTIRNRLARQESTLTKIQTTLDNILRIQEVQLKHPTVTSLDR